MSTCQLCFGAGYIHRTPIQSNTATEASGPCPRCTAPREELERTMLRLELGCEGNRLYVQQLGLATRERDNALAALTSTRDALRLAIQEVRVGAAGLREANSPRAKRQEQVADMLETRLEETP